MLVVVDLDRSIWLPFHYSLSMIVLIYNNCSGMVTDCLSIHLDCECNLFANKETILAINRVINVCLIAALFQIFYRS